ncbi:MAG: ABC transporter permease, partial [Rhodospirillaceae bacterium]|nr:ABC transporter permease [Rhodospirillaceae bacterium]
ALGVASIAAVGSLSASVQAGLEADAQRLLGGDIDFRTQHAPAPADAMAYLEQNTARLSKTFELKTMAQTTGRRALVELKAVDETYPLVSRLEFSPPADGVQNLLAKRDGIYGAAVEPGLLIKLKLDIGDLVNIGETQFQIRATIVLEPDKVATLINFGPRLMILSRALAQTQLVQPGSQIHYHTRVLLKPGTDSEAFLENLETQFPKAGWRVRGLDKAAPGIERFTERFALFLSFAGMTALLVGGFGVFGAVQSYLETKLETIATFKCIGASGDLVFRAYLLQILTLSALGIAIGLVAGALLPLLGIELVKPYLPMQPRAGIYFEPLFQAAVFGMLISVTFALWPLAQARETPAANLFRTLVVPGSGRPKPVFIWMFVAGILLLATLVIVWSVERNFAVWFVGVSALTIAMLYAGGGMVQSLAKRAPHLQSATGRLVIGNLHRPGNTTRRVVMALGVGLSVLVGVA